jgi:hypothetical protein
MRLIVGGYRSRGAISLLACAAIATACSHGPTAAQQAAARQRAFQQAVAPRLATIRADVTGIESILDRASKANALEYPSLFDPLTTSLRRDAAALTPIAASQDVRSKLADLTRVLTSIVSEIAAVQRFLTLKVSLALGRQVLDALVRDERTSVQIVLGLSPQLASPSASPVPSTAPESAVPTTGTGPVRHTLAELLADDPAGTESSGVTHTYYGTVAVIVRPNPGEYKGSTIDIAEESVAGWQVISSFKGDDFSQPFAAPRPIHVTSSLAADFFVPTAGGDVELDFVVTHATGSWSLARFVTQGQPDSTIVGDARATSAGIDSEGNNCIPNCADGTHFITHFVWAPDEGEFVPSG